MNLIGHLKKKQAIDPCASTGVQMSDDADKNGTDSVKWPCDIGSY